MRHTGMNLMLDRKTVSCKHDPTISLLFLSYERLDDEISWIMRRYEEKGRVLFWRRYRHSLASRLQIEELVIFLGSVRILIFVRRFQE